MTLPTFNPDPRPTPGTAVSNNVALRTTQFGDGYTQSVPVGLNHVSKRVTLTWGALTLSQAQALDDFFVERGGYKYFYYTLRGESTPRKWRCEKWSFTDGAPSNSTADLIEVFTNQV